MMGKIKEPVVLVQCQCKHHDAVHCLALKYDVSVDLIRCMECVCSCRCHRKSNGIAIQRDVWAERVRLAMR